LRKPASSRSRCFHKERSMCQKGVRGRVLCCGGVASRIRYM